MAVYSRLFKAVAWATVGWVLLLLVGRNVVFGLLGVTSAFYLNTALMGALAALSGPILLHHIRSNPREYKERGEWTPETLFFAVVFFISLFIFLSSLAYLGLSG